MKVIAKVTKAEAIILDEHGRPVMEYSVENSSFELDLAALIACGAKLVQDVMKQDALVKAQITSHTIE